MSLKVYKVESMKIERFEDIIGDFTPLTWTSHNQTNNKSQNTNNK